MADSFEEKTEAPTPRRREMARRRGEFARSDDLCAAAVLLTAVLMLQVTGPRLIAAWKVSVADAMTLKTPAATELLVVMGQAVWPMLLAIVLAAVAVNLVQAGFGFRFRAKWEAISPTKGFERVFSKRSAGAIVMHVIKITAVALVAWLASRGLIGRIVSLQTLPPAEGMMAGAGIVMAVGVRLALVLLALAAADYAIKWWRHEKDLRMTRRELREEMREMQIHEGVKHRQRELAAGRMT
jgi:flagellar biosynthetic protein FlhB